MLLRTVAREVLWKIWILFKDSVRFRFVIIQDNISSILNYLFIITNNMFNYVRFDNKYTTPLKFGIHNLTIEH